MEFLEILKISIKSLNANKLRAGLTILGIVVGIFSIIIIMTIVTILQDSIETGFSQLGKNTFQIQKMPAMHSNDPKEMAKIRKRKNITIEEFKRLKEVLTDAKYVAAERWKWGIIAKYGNKETNPNFVLAGITPEAMQTNNWNLSEGRSIRQLDEDMATDVVIIGNDITEKLFGRINPIGQSIKIGGVKLEIVGILEKEGERFGNSQDNKLIIPYSTFAKMYGQVDPFLMREGSINITVMSHSKDDYDELIDKAVGAFRIVRGVKAGEDNDFDVYSNESLISQVNDVTSGVKIGAFVIAAIALIAAGIGIMNIMLVSVTERTKEIGIRKSVGAVKTDILFQFLTEAILLCVGGGLIGILIGVLSGNIVAGLIKVSSGGLTIPYLWISVGVFLCILVGIIFGTYPAYKASSLDPIEALRYE